MYSYPTYCVVEIWNETRDKLQHIQNLRGIRKALITYCQEKSLLVFYYVNSSIGHESLWDVKRKLHPHTHALPMDDLTWYDRQLPFPSIDDYNIDPDFPAEAFF